MTTIELQKEILRRAFAKASGRQVAAAQQTYKAQMRDRERRGQPETEFMRMFGEVLDQAAKLSNSIVFKALEARDSAFTPRPVTINAEPTKNKNVIDTSGDDGVTPCLTPDELARCGLDAGSISFLRRAVPSALPWGPQKKGQ